MHLSNIDWPFADHWLRRLLNVSTCVAVVDRQRTLRSNKNRSVWFECNTIKSKSHSQRWVLLVSWGDGVTIRCTLTRTQHICCTHSRSAFQPKWWKPAECYACAVSLTDGRTPYDTCLPLNSLHLYKKYIICLMHVAWCIASSLHPHVRFAWEPFGIPFQKLHFQLYCCFC